MEGAALTLKAAINALHSASPNWYQIGVQLDVPSHVLKNIKQENPRQKDCLTELLEFWMKNAIDPPPSWRALIDALKADSVGEKRLAGELEDKYCKQKEQGSSKLQDQNCGSYTKVNQVRDSQRRRQQSDAPVSENSTTIAAKQSSSTTKSEVTPEQQLVLRTLPSSFRLLDLSGPTPEQLKALRGRELNPGLPKMEELHDQDGACRTKANQVRVSGNQIHAPVLKSSTTNIATMALSKDSCHPNGVPKTHKVPRSAAGFRPASDFVAAIDFGTTYCSVAYTLQQESKEILKLPIDGPLTRVPNAILIERRTNTVNAFGQRAQYMFSMMKKEDRDKYIYFERMKMILYRRRDVSRTTPVRPVNSDEEYYLVDVVALILKYLRDHLYDCVRVKGFDMSKIQFDWVITVPAIWDNRGRQMMREAAYKAGLCSSTPSCNLIPCRIFRKLERPVEKSPDRLSLALEPEVAGLYCQNSGELHIKPKHFTVLDIGGGTVDITSYHIDEGGHITLKGKASGSDWGGTRVNEQFGKFLQTIVSDPDFRQYLHVPNVQLQQQHWADLNKLIYESFEHQKILFGDEDDDDKRFAAVIFIPKSFGKFYKQEKLEKAISEKYNSVAELDGLELTIEPQKMKEFFQPAIEQIRRYAFLALEKVKQEVGKLEVLYLVGGFGGCKFIKKALQDMIRDRYGYQLEVFVPVDHKMAVACGAVKFRHNPEITWARKAEHTYGYVVNSPFDADIHDPAYKMKNGEGKDSCRDLFHPFIEIGDTICGDEVLQNSITPPFSSSMPCMMVTIYSSNERNIWYARDKDGKLVFGLKEVGTLVFEFPRDSDDKRVVFTIDLSQTEIHLKAKHEKTGKEVKVVLDCP